MAKNPFALPPKIIGKTPAWQKPPKAKAKPKPPKRAPVGPQGPKAYTKSRQKPRGPKGPVGHRPLVHPDHLLPQLGPHGTGPIGLKASRRDAQVGYHNPITAAARGVYGLNKTVYKPVYNAVGGLIHQRNISAQDRADMNASGNAVWQETGIPAFREAASDPGKSIGADVLAVAGILPLPFGKAARLARLAEAGAVEKGAEAAARAIPESRAARGLARRQAKLEARRAKKALIRGPKRTHEQTDAYLEELFRNDAAKVDVARAEGKMGGPVNILKPGEITPETGGAVGQKVRHALNPDLKGGGKYEKIGAKLDDPRMLYKQQEETLRGPFRLEQARNMGRAGEGKDGMDWLKAVSAARKGEHPSLEFRGLANLTPELRDEAINFIRDTPNMRIHESANAAIALDRMMAGHVPTPAEVALLERAFGKEMADGVIAQAKKAGWGKTALDVLGISRSLRSAIDFSFMLRQAAVALAYNPRIWGKTLGPAFKGMFSEGRYQNDMKAVEALPSHNSAVRSGVSFVDIGKDRATGASDLYLRDEAMPSNYAEQLPFGVGATVRGSDRGYVGMGNLIRGHLFDWMIRKAARQGYHLTDDALKDIAQAVNTMTGRGDLKRWKGLQEFLNATLFSPRLLKSRVNMANPFWYRGLSPFARKEAIKGGTKFFGAIGLTLMAVEEMTGGHVEFDPRSADFGKIRIGDTRIDLGAGFNQLLHLYGQFATLHRKSTTTGEVSFLGGGYGQDSVFSVGIQFFENKTNPLLSTGINIAKGNQFGRPLDFSPNPLDTNSLISNLWEPMSPQDALATYQQTGSPAAGIGGGLLAATGVGVQSYSSSTAKSAKKSPTPARELTHQLNRLGITNPKARATFQRAIHVKAQRDRAKDAARKASPSKKISEAEAYKITMQTLLRNKMMTPAVYRGMVAAIPRMNHHQLVYYEDQAWNELGPGRLLEWFHHQYNVATGK